MKTISIRLATSFASLMLTAISVGADPLVDSWFTAVPEPDLRQQRTGCRIQGPRPLRRDEKGRRQRQVRRPLAAECRSHRAVHARRAVQDAGGSRRTLQHWGETQRDARPKYRQAPGWRRAVERRGSARAH